MKRCFVVACLIFGFGLGLHAQVVDTTVCDVVRKPASFNGKIVRIKGTVSVDFDQFALTDSDCGFQVNGIWISYPQGTKGKAGPVAVLEVQPAHNYSGTVKPVTRTPVTLEKDKDFKQFDSLLSQTRYKGAGLCIACFKYKVTATLVGRLDGVSEAYLHRDPSGKIVGFGGFGNMNAYPARLVLQSVSDVSAKEVDYSATDAANKDAMAPPPGFGGGPGGYSDPVDDARKLIAMVPAGQMATELQKDLAVFPKAKEQNGVTVTWSTVNEAPASDYAPGAKDSPDGVLFNCSIDKDRLDPRTVTWVIVYMGRHIVDLRSETAANETTPPYVLEYNALSVALVSTIDSGAKTVTIPGGLMVWNMAWPSADRNSKFEAALKSYLLTEEMVSQ